MIERIYEFSYGEEKIIEKIIDDENIVINHVILEKNDLLPEHYSNSNVYLIILSGEITIRLDEEEEKEYKRGSIITIPYNTKMNIKNSKDEQLKFIIVKAPNPKKI